MVGVVHPCKLYPFSFRQTIIIFWSAKLLYWQNNFRIKMRLAGQHGDLRECIRIFDIIAQTSKADLYRIGQNGKNYFKNHFDTQNH